MARASDSPVKLVVVRRGQFAAFELLAHTFADDPTIQVIWDRRVGERRQERRSAGTDNRRTDRRTAPPLALHHHDYAVASARSDMAARSQA